MRKRIFYRIVSFLVLVTVLTSCGTTKETMQWEPAWEPDAGKIQSIDGLSLYVDAQTLYPGSKSLNLIVVNETGKELKIAGGSGEGNIEKYVLNCWSIPKVERKPHTAELNWVTIPQGSAISRSVDLPHFVQGLTPGDYRFSITVLGETADGDIYVYHAFTVMPEQDNEP